MKYRIVTTRSGKYQVQNKLGWYDLIGWGNVGPQFNSVEEARFAIEEVERYRAFKPKQVWP